jgi:hypothetical protein
MIPKGIINNNDKNFITLCPTNKAALIIPGAMTIHKFKNNMRRMNYFKNSNIDYIFVDEIINSMMILNLLCVVILNNLNPLMIYNGNYKNSSALLELSDGNRLNLTTCRRVVIYF